jgi:hypothetical protein
MHPAESRSFPMLGRHSRHFAGATSVRSRIDKGRLAAAPASQRSSVRDYGLLIENS